MALLLAILWHTACSYPNLPDFSVKCEDDQDCAQHEFCNDNSSGCECVAGYTRRSAGCEWIGVITDPGFASTSTWITANLAVITTTTSLPPKQDPGVAQLPASDSGCSATLTQHVVMPRYERAEPLIAVMTYRDPPSFIAGVAPALGIGTAWTEFPYAAGSGWQTERRCLGAGQYASPDSKGPGEEMLLTIGRTLEPACHFDGLDIDRVDIVPSMPGECPRPGQVVNGNAEDDGGWTFAMSDGGTAAFVSGVGQDGTRGAKLFMSTRCSKAMADIPFQFGMANLQGSPALSYYIATGANTNITAEIGQREFVKATLNDLPIARTVQTCIPPHLRGTSSHLRIRPFSDGPCDGPINIAAVVDTVALSNEPGCGSNPAISDPGFESGFPPFDSRGAVASIFDPNAHSGVRMLELQQDSCVASSPRLVTYVLVPKPTTAGGPKFVFWYRMNSGTHTTLQATWGNPMFSQALPRNTQWSQGGVCLDPSRAGRVQPVHLLLGSESCTGTFPTESAFIDDLDVINDSSCPTM